MENSTIPDENWGPEVGTSQFPATFDYDWGAGAVYSAYSDYIGFNATMQVNMTRNGPVCFTLGSNDASALWLDSSASALISLGKYDTYNTETKVVYLAEGIHDLMLRYYDVQGNAE